MFSKRERNNVDKDCFIGHFIYFGPILKCRKLWWGQQIAVSLLASSSIPEQVLGSFSLVRKSNLGKPFSSYGFQIRAEFQCTEFSECHPADSIKPNGSAGSSTVQTPKADKQLILAQNPHKITVFTRG